MDEINALAKLYGRSIDKGNKNIFGFQNGKEFSLYQNSLQKAFPDDFVASNHLYGSNPNDVRYKMLKVRLKKKLYNNLFLLDYEKLKIAKVYQSELECIKLLHHAQVLHRMYEFDLVLNLVSKIKKIAYKYEFLNFLIAATELELVCYTDSGQYKEFRNCSKYLNNLLKIKFYERQAHTLYQSLKLDGKRTVKLRSNKILTFSEQINKLYILHIKANTFDSFNSYYKASIMYNEMVGNFEAIVDLTVNAEKKVIKGEINPHRFDRNFNKFELVYSHLRAKKLEKGVEYASKYLDEFTEYTPNWYAFLENYFLLALHSCKYELASALIYKVLESLNFNKLSSSAKERWNLYEAYFLVVSKTELEQSSEKNPFFLFLQEYSKDKQGFNVALLILQFLYYLQKKDTEALLYRIESLKKYILTHLKDSFSLRSKIFLKLLILTVTEDYDSEKCRKKGQKLYQKLTETPTPGDAYAEIEIVPYEHLWEHILETLEKHY